MFSGFDDVFPHDRQDDAATTSRSSSSSSDGEASSVTSSEIGTYTRKRGSAGAADVGVKTETPRLLFTSSNNTNEQKRSKHDEKLIRNRESANKSRLKKKQEKMNLEATIS